MRLTVLTWNLRYDVPSDGPRRWAHRRAGIEVELARMAPDLAAFQELLPHQLSDLRAMLPNYTVIGEGREGLGAGEHCPLAWTDSLQLLESGTFWLSTQVDRVSVGWDAMLPRICTWARLSAAGRRLAIYNVHLDHHGPQARLESIRLVLERAQSRAESLIILGDFNAEEDSPPVQACRRDLVDAYRDRHPEGPPPTTYHDFGLGDGPRIDYLFVSPDLRVVEARVEAPGNGQALSDHHPVRVTLEL